MRTVPYPGLRGKAGCDRVRATEPFVGSGEQDGVVFVYPFRVLANPGRWLTFRKRRWGRGRQVCIWVLRRASQACRNVCTFVHRQINNTTYRGMRPLLGDHGHNTLTWRRADKQPSSQVHAKRFPMREIITPGYDPTGTTSIDIPSMDDLEPSREEVKTEWYF